MAFLDIGMPNMSGYELAQRLRHRRETERTVLVAVTGWGQETDRASAKRAGFDHHFVKPVDFDAIYALIEREQHAAPAAQGASIA
jgi:two-component system CheB/CheR fusion protein